MAGEIKVIGKSEFEQLVVMTNYGYITHCNEVGQMSIVGIQKCPKVTDLFLIQHVSGRDLVTGVVVKPEYTDAPTCRGCKGAKVLKLSAEPKTS